MQLQEIQQKITPLLQRSNIEYAGVFGSVARGGATGNSDIDILVKFRNQPTFSAYLKLDNDLRKELGQDIDLLTEGSVNKFLRPQIEQDLKIIYGSRT